ncbi:MAG: AAA family ATPase [Prevotella sp.]
MSVRSVTDRANGITGTDLSHVPPKTEYAMNMIHLSNYIILSLPRRFGRSLLVSTLQAYPLPPKTLMCY